MLRRIVLLIGCCVAWWSAQAQYFQYSQYNFTAQRINPAMAGLTRYATAGTAYRHQRTGGDISINSNFVNVSYPLLNSSTGVPWSGVALSLHNDQSASVFKTQEISLGYALHVRTSKFQVLSLGAKFLHQSRKVGLNGFYTGSQYVPDRGFDPNQFSGEVFTELRSSFNTFSVGMFWRQVDKKGRQLHHLGISLFDFNKPVDAFFDGTTHLPSTFIINGGVQTYSNGGINIFPEGLLTLSGRTAMFNGGIRIQKELNVKAKKPSDLVDLLIKYAVGRSGILGVQLHRENISVGVSYDFPVIRKNPGNTGAVEFGIELRRLVHTRAQKITARRKKAADEKRQALARKQTVPTKNVRATLSDSVGFIAIDPADTTTTTPLAPVEIVDIQPDNGTPTAEAGGMKQEPMIMEKVTLHFAFEFNSFDLDEPTEEFLDQLADNLKQNEHLELDIEGHTDNIGSDKFNLRLSQKRADVVKALLVKKGIAPERLHVGGKGMREPLNENLTDADRARNRRVEITVFY